jgi:tripartite-type tricarboxylate transporter receptor subunit TctC
MNILVRAAAAFALCAAAATAAAQPYPHRPVRFIVGFQPGGGSDIMARIVASKLGETAGVATIVENRPGANGNVAADAAAKMAGDGYTVLQISVSHAISKSLYKGLKYDLEKDFQPLVAVSSVPQVVVVYPGFPAKTLGDLIALAKARPGEVAYASSGSGSPEHVAAEMLAWMAGIKLNHVPYKGGAASANDIMGGQVPVGFNTMPVAAPHIRAGKMRLLAVTDERRSAVFPDAPTVAEAGVPGYAMSTWYGLVVPTGTPADAVAFLNREINRILAMPDVKERFAPLGAEPTGGTPAEFGSFIRNEVVKYGRVAAEAHLKVE